MLQAKVDITTPTLTTRIDDARADVASRGVGELVVEACGNRTAIKPAHFATERKRRRVAANSSRHDEDKCSRLGMD
jgi:hypothetical protein